MGDGYFDNGPWKELLSRMPGGLFIYESDEKEKIRYINDDILKLYRCETREQFETLTGNSFQGMVHPDDLERVEQEIRYQISDGEYDYVEYRIRCRDGKVLWVEDYGRLVRTEDGEMLFYVFLADATEKKKLRDIVNRRDHLQQVLTTLANDVVFDIRCRYCTVDVYGYFEQRFGRRPKKSDFIPFMCGNCKDRQDLKLRIHSYPAKEKQFTRMEQDVIVTGEDKSNIWTRCQIARFEGSDGEYDREIGRMLDTHEQTMREIYYRQGAEKDCLTGIYNRRSAESLIRKYLETMEEKECCMMVMLDIDGFKQLNDTYGHPFGDNVLLQVACALQNTFRKNDICARIGGDEFMVFLKDVRDKSVCLKRLQQLVACAVQSEEADACNATLSAGVSIQTGAGVTFREMYQKADRALYEAKRSGKRSFRVYMEEE